MYVVPYLAFRFHFTARMKETLNFTRKPFDKHGHKPKTAIGSCTKMVRQQLPSFSLIHILLLIAVASVQSFVSIKMQAECGLSTRFNSFTANLSARLGDEYGTSPSDEDKNSNNKNNKGSYKHVKGIIFDIDGTLADSWKLGYDATAVILEKYNIAGITPELYHQCTRYATPDRLARHAGLEPGSSEFQRVGSQLAQEFDDLYVSLVSTQTAGFFPGVDTLLQHLACHVKLGALTNAAVRYAHAVLQANCPIASETKGGERSSGEHQTQLKYSDRAIYDRFLSIRGADNVPEPKPSPAGLLTVCQDLGLDPSDCVYVGDSPSDGEAARAAGMPAVAVLWGSHDETSLRQAPFTHFCETVEELAAMFPMR